MGKALEQRLRQSRFQDYRQEAMLNVFVAASHLNEKVEKLCATYGITHQQYNILRILRGVHPKGQPCGEIARWMLDRAPDVTRRLDKLETMGLVERARDTDDRRVVIARVTPQGLTLLEQMDDPIIEVYEYVGRKLTEEQCKELSGLCERVYGADE